MNRKKLIKKLSIGVASLALVAPLVLGGMQLAPVHAESLAQAYRDFKEADDNTSASTKAQDKKIDDNLENTEEKNEIHLVRTDPGEAYIDAQDLGTLSPAVRKVVKAVYSRDVKKGLVPQLNGHYLHRRHHAKKHVARRHNHRSNHRSHIRKHARKRVRRFSHRRHGESLAQFYADVKKSEDNTPASVKAENKKHGEELQAVEDKNEIKLVKNDPDEAYMDAEDANQLSPAVRKVVEVVYPRDVRKGLEPQLTGRYLHRYHARKHGRTKKHVARRHRARKHIKRIRKHLKNQNK